MAVPGETTLHTRIKVHKRSAGKSALACAAYRAAELLMDDRTGQSFDYSRHKGVEHTEIVAPDGAPAWALNRSELWNRVEAGEKRKDAQLAREAEIMFAYGLTPEQRKAEARGAAGDLPQARRAGLHPDRGRPLPLQRRRVLLSARARSTH